MKILAIGAHPDDVEFGAAPLLIKEVQKGNQAKIVVCSLGEAGTSGTPQGRKREAADAAKAIGAEIEFLNLGGGLGAIGSFRDTDDGHVVDTTKKVTFKGKPFAAPDVLTGGTTLIPHACQGAGTIAAAFAK